MKAKMTLWRDGAAQFERIYDWAATIKTNNGPKQVSKISLYDDKVILGGEEYFIVHMLSANSFAD